MFQRFEIGIRCCRHNPRRDCDRLTKRCPTYSPFRGGEGVRGGRDILAGDMERVLQEVQNVIFDIPKSFQLIKALLLPRLTSPELKGCWKLRPPVISRQRVGRSGNSWQTPRFRRYLDRI